VQKVAIGGELQLHDVLAVAEGRAVVFVPEIVHSRVRHCRDQIEARLGGTQLHYGINTGFGALAEVRIDDARIRELQRNLVRSHACGVGAPLPTSAVRAMMLLRAQVLALGHSGARCEILDLLAGMLNQKVHPVIPSMGSVGASGDLAPLAHLALVLIGEGVAEHNGVVLDGGQALSKAGLLPVELHAKEGLSLINGTQAMTALGTIAWDMAERLVRSADVIGALSVDASTGSRTAFDPRIHKVRPYEGQRISADNVYRLLDGSLLLESHADCAKVQDPYSLRCLPQVHGATRTGLAYVASTLLIEVNSVTDNPLIFDNDILSGGNFHGQPVAFALDHLGVVLAELANISERRIEQLVNPALSSGLPAFLTRNSGLNSGFMIPQVTAAALVTENKRLAAPASVDSIPSSANREDHVSMGMHSAVKAITIGEHVSTVLGIELMCAAQGLDLRRPLQSSKPLESLHAEYRREVDVLEEDRVLYGDIELSAQFVRDGRVLESVLAAGVTVN
jgi:histidine ammonia-lyase